MSRQPKLTWDVTLAQTHVRCHVSPPDALLVLHDEPPLVCEVAEAAAAGLVFAVCFVSALLEELVVVPAFVAELRRWSTCECPTVN